LYFAFSIIIIPSLISYIPLNEVLILNLSSNSARVIIQLLLTNFIQLNLVFACRAVKFIIPFQAIIKAKLNPNLMPNSSGLANDFLLTKFE